MSSWGASVRANPPPPSPASHPGEHLDSAGAERGLPWGWASPSHHHTKLAALGWGQRGVSCLRGRGLVVPKPPPLLPAPAFAQLLCSYQIPAPYGVTTLGTSPGPGPAPAWLELGVAGLRPVSSTSPRGGGGLTQGWALRSAPQAQGPAGRAPNVPDHFMCNCALTPQVPHIYAMQPGGGRGLAAPPCPPGPAKPLLGHLPLCRSWPGPTACTSTPRSQSAALPRPRYNQRIRRFVLKLVFLYAAAAVLGPGEGKGRVEAFGGGGRAPLRASHVVPPAPLRAANVVLSSPRRPLPVVPSSPPSCGRCPWFPPPHPPPAPRTWFAPRPAPRAAIGPAATSGPATTSASGAPCEGAAAGPWRRAGCEGHGGPARREAGGRRPGPAAPAGAPAPRGQRRRRRARPEAGEGR